MMAGREPPSPGEATLVAVEPPMMIPGEGVYPGARGVPKAVPAPGIEGSLPGQWGVGSLPGAAGPDGLANEAGLYPGAFGGAAGTGLAAIFTPLLSKLRSTTVP